MALTPPPELKSKIIVIAFLTAAEGKADEMQKLLSTLRQHSNSDKEPNALTYRTTRGVGAESNKFTVFEEYADKKAIEDHVITDVFKALQASGTVASLTAEFREEFF
ncbi:hypothetical protein L218DRAFT_959808 [Marasmius fiardii PR-910]|nr:hypothetical protein L218DRAFT_959808 [Marasmius fiardii PR-910]